MIKRTFKSIFPFIFGINLVVACASKDYSETVADLKVNRTYRQWKNYRSCVDREKSRLQVLGIRYDGPETKVADDGNWVEFNGAQVKNLNIDHFRKICSAGLKSKFCYVLTGGDRVQDPTDSALFPEIDGL